MKNKLLVFFFIVLLLPKMGADTYESEIKIKTEVYKDGTLDSSLTEIYKGMFINIEGPYRLKVVDYNLENGEIELDLYKGNKKETLYKRDCDRDIYEASNLLECCPACSNTLVYENKYCDISIQFHCFDRDATTQEEEETCCSSVESTTTVGTYTKLQIYFHKKYDTIAEKTLIEMEEEGLLDNNEKGYQVSKDEIIVSDPYYITLKDDKFMVYETDYGAKLSLNIPMPEFRMNKTSYAGHTIGIINDTIFSTMNPADPLYATVNNSEMNEGGYITSSLRTIETVEGMMNLCKLIVGEDIYTVYDGKENIIFKDSFGIVVTKFDPTAKEVYLKFLKKVDEKEIDTSSLAESDQQITFNETYSNLFIDVVSGSRILKNKVGLRYEDVQGRSYEEMPFEKDSTETTVTYMNLSVKGENPNAHDFTGSGWADTAPPNFRYATPGENNYGTCVRGDEITYTIDYSYSPLAADDATNVSLTATLDTNLDFASATSSYSYDPATNTVTWNIGTLHPGDSGTVQVTATVKDGTTYGTEIPSDITLSYTEEGTPQSISPNPVLFKVQAMDILKEVSDTSATPGDTLTYTLTYYNTTSSGREYGTPPVPSTIDVTDIDIEDEIPNDVTVGSISDGGSVSGNTIEWSGLTTLNPESSHALTFQATVDSVTSSTTIHNNATIVEYNLYGSDSGDPNGTSSSQETDSHGITSNTVHTTVTVPSGVARSTLPCCKMDVAKEAPLTAVPGDIITYTIRYQNTGICANGNAYNVKILDTLPENMTFINASIAPIVDGNLLLWQIPQVNAGESGTITVDAMVNPDISENAYYVRAYEYKKYAKVNEQWVGLGGMISYDDYSLILEETHKYWYDNNGVQIHKGSQKLGEPLMALYQRCVYDGMVFEFLDNTGTGEKFKGLFRIYKRVVPNVQTSSEFKRWDKEEEIWSSGIYANDTFYLFVSLKNVKDDLNIGKGMARNIQYSIESELPCKDVTWMYPNPCGENYFDLYPGETGDIILEMEAPSLNFEKEYTTTLNISWEDDVGTSYNTEKTYTVNIKPNPQEKVLRVEKHVVGEKELKVGETKRIQIFIRNWSEKEQYVEFEDNIPQGLSVVEGSPTFEGKIQSDETVEIDYTLKAEEEGTYSFSGKAYYEDVYGRHKVVSNTIDIHVIGTEKLTMTKEISKNYLNTGETVNISLMLRNNTEESIKDIEAVDIIPEEFHLVKIYTDNIEWDSENKILRYNIDELRPSEAKIVKYAIKAPVEPGKYRILGLRATYTIDKTKKEKTSPDFDVVIPEAEPPTVDAGMVVLDRIPSEEKEILTLQLTLRGETSTAKNLTVTLDHTGFKVIDTEGKRNNGLMYEIGELKPGETYITKSTFETPVGDKELSFTLNGSYQDRSGVEHSLNKQLSVPFITKKPIVTITRSLEEGEIRFGYSTQLVYTLENTGESEAEVVLQDDLPSSVGKDYSWGGELDPGERHSLRYAITPTRPGEVILSSARVEYKDRFGNKYTAHTEETTLNVQGVVLEKTFKGNTVELTVTNTYSEKAFALTIVDRIPSGFETNSSRIFELSRLNAGESKTFSYTFTKMGDAAELPGAVVEWRDIYNDSYQAVSQSTPISREEEEKEEEEEEKEKEETPTPPPSTTAPPTPEQPGPGIDLRYVFIPVIVTIVVFLLYLLISKRREEYGEGYGIPSYDETVTEEDIWGEDETVERTERRAERRVLGGMRSYDTEESDREIERPSRESIEMEELWNMSTVKKKEKKKKISNPVEPKLFAQKTKEKEMWKNHIKNSELRALEKDLKNLEKKEEEYREMGKEDMLKEIEGLKRIVKNEMEEKESYERNT